MHSYFYWINWCFRCWNCKTNPRDGINLVDKNNIPKEYNLFTISDKDTKDYVVKNLIKEFQQKYGEKALFIKK